MSILENFPWARVRVDLWFVETNKLDRNAFSFFMGTRGYTCMHVDHVNSLCERGDRGVG